MNDSLKSSLRDVGTEVHFAPAPEWVRWLWAAFGLLILMSAVDFRQSVEGQEACFYFDVPIANGHH